MCLSFLTRKSSTNLHGWFEFLIMTYLELGHLANFVPGNRNSHNLIFRKDLLDKSHGCSTSHFPSRRRESGFERLKAFLSSFNKIVATLKIEVSRLLAVALFHLVLSHWIKFYFPVVLSPPIKVLWIAVIQEMHQLSWGWYEIWKKTTRCYHWTFEFQMTVPQSFCDSQGS